MPLREWARLPSPHFAPPHQHEMRALQRYASLRDRMRVFVAPAAEDHEIRHALAAESYIRPVMRFEIPAERAAGTAAYGLPLHPPSALLPPAWRLQELVVSIVAEPFELFGELDIDRFFRYGARSGEAGKVAAPIRFARNPEKRRDPAAQRERLEQHDGKIVATAGCGIYELREAPEERHVD